MTGWTVERLRAAAGRPDVTEFERRRRERMQERAVVARIYPRGNVVAFPSRPPEPPRAA